MSTLITEEIPLFPDTSNFRMRVVLSGVEFLLILDYNGRQDRWFISVYDSLENPIQLRIKAKTNWPILRRCVDSRRPRGMLMFFDPTSGLPAGFSDLGRRVRLIYLSADGATSGGVGAATPAS